KGEKEIEEEGSKSSTQRAAKKRKIDEETKELKKHLQFVPKDEDNIYTEATPLALKVLIIDYQIHHEHNKPFYKIIKADGTYQLFLSFITLLKNFNREDLEMLWKLAQERFQSSELKNFSDDFLLNTLKYKVSIVQIVSAASIVVNTVSSKLVPEKSPKRIPKEDLKEDPKENPKEEPEEEELKKKWLKETSKSDPNTLPPDYTVPNEETKTDMDSTTRCETKP
nr:hypothetical protein [Tanacetum cinerariifolium]